VTVLEVIHRSTEFLARKGVDSPRLQVELLLGHVLDVPRLRLYLDFERQLTDGQLSILRELVKRRAQREPLQHILGSTSFCGLEIKVNQHVLIPRPETEVLAEHAWAFLKRKAEESERDVLALDLGTGSGCLAIAIATHVRSARVYALDISPAAIQVARDNAAAHRLSDRINFVEGNGIGALEGSPRFDLIVSNPPYIASADVKRLAPEVRDHDPRLALDGGIDGLDFYRQLATAAGPFICGGGALMCEFGDGQGEAVRALFEAERWRTESLVPDLAGRARILVARREES
jgi:release factor glutamine methyltransferase